MSAIENTPSLPFLVQTNYPNVENNLYPFVFHYPGGNLFIFANNHAILFDYSNNQVLKTYTTMPDGQPRNYPSTCSAILLPLQGTVNSVEVLVCAGAPKGAFINANKGIFDGALDTCGRIKISDPKLQRVMENLPLARVMRDMFLLSNGHVLIINGASARVAGWELGRNLVLSPVVYQPNKQVGSRFEVQNLCTKPRVYHSTTVLLLDGRVLVGGSNPYDKYEFINILYPTELSSEAFSPYLVSKSSDLRPKIILPVKNTKIGYGKQLVIVFTVSGTVDPSSVSVAMVAPPFNTHSFSMNQRLLVLDGGVAAKILGKSSYQVVVTTPPTVTLL